MSSKASGDGCESAECRPSRVAGIDRRAAGTAIVDHGPASRVTSPGPRIVLVVLLLASCQTFRPDAWERRFGDPGAAYMGIDVVRIGGADERFRALATATRRDGETLADRRVLLMTISGRGELTESTAILLADPLLWGHMSGATGSGTAVAGVVRHGDRCGLLFLCVGDSDCSTTCTIVDTFANGNVAGLAPVDDDRFMLAGTRDYRSLNLWTVSRTGRLLRTRAFDRSVGSYAGTIRPTEGGYLVLSSTDAGLFLVKIDSNCDSIWSRFYAGAGSYSTLEALAGGGMIAAGCTGGKLRMMGLSDAGDVLWTNSAAVGAVEYGQVRVASDGTVVLIATRYSADLQHSCGFLAGYDENARPLWQKEFGQSSADAEFRAGAETEDGGWVALGGFGNMSGDRELYVVRHCPQIGH